MKFSNEALDCGFFRTVELIRDKYNKGQLEVVDENTVLHRTRQGEYLVRDKLNHNGVRYAVKRVIEILNSLDKLDTVEGFLHAWEQGLLGDKIYNLNDYVLLDCLRCLYETVPNITYHSIRDNYRRLRQQLVNRFGSLRNAFELIGVNYDAILFQGNNNVLSTKGLLFERIAGEVFNELGHELEEQYDIVGDGSTRIDYYDRKNNIGYECKLSDHTVFRDWCDTLKKYPQHLNKLYIVYCESGGGKKRNIFRNVEFAPISKFINKIQCPKKRQQFTTKIEELYSIEHPQEEKGICYYCKSDFTKKTPNALYCSKKCRDAVSRNRYRFRKAAGKKCDLHYHNCVECGKLFISPTGKRQYCSDNCRSKMYYRTHRKTKATA